MFTEASHIRDELGLEGLEALQQPQWPDPVHLELMRNELGSREALVGPEGPKQLLAGLGEVSAGQALMLQAGSCAELLSDTPESTRNLLTIILAMNIVLAQAAEVPVVKTARLAGQFNKPRSSETEEQDGLILPSYRGDGVNGFDFTPEARHPDPERLLRVYDHSRATRELLLALASSDFADLQHVHEWNQRFVISSSQRERFHGVTEEIRKSINFMRALKVDVTRLGALHQAEVFTSHEALVFDYELPLTRVNDEGKLYDSSADMLWIGERTRQLNGAHIAFVAGIQNPVAIKLGPTTTVDEVIAICERLNPDRVPGRLTLISRMGAGKVETALPPLVRAVQENEHPVVWICDPMHGNTITTESGQKTRKLSDITDELHSYFAIHRQAGTWPGGVHLEITGEHVTECLGGSGQNSVSDLTPNYTTTCDPRLNAEQSLELAFLIGEELTQ